MLPTVGDPLVGTFIVGAALLIALALSAKKATGEPRLDVTTSTSLKGAAALAVIFCHVGYFLVNDHRFLFPLSAAGGVAVDLFLLLSGYGLAVGALKKELRPLAFYRRRVIRLFGPLWLSLIIVLALDHWRLGIDWPWLETSLAFGGVIRSADIFTSLNSPLWYVTLSLFFYAIFPWAFRRRHPMRSVVLITALGYAWCDWVAPRLLPGVAGLYGLHRFAFPLGTLMAVLAAQRDIRAAWQRTKPARWGRGRRATTAFLLAALAGYLVVHSGVGKSANVEESLSLLTVLLTVGAAMTLPWKLSLLSVLGASSYEIYLLHWPLLARHGLFIEGLPSWASVLVAVAALWAAGLALRVLVTRLTPPVGGERNLVS